MGRTPFCNNVKRLISQVTTVPSGRQGFTCKVDNRGMESEFVGYYLVHLKPFY
jgi:hypothetical protein